MGHAYLESKDAAGLCQAIIALMPVHSDYIESHLGRGAIMKRKPAAQRNIGIVVDAAVIAQFRCDYAVGMVQGCCHNYLSEFEFDGSELIYADPPYLQSIRKALGRYRCRYVYEDKDHVRLLAILKDLPCRVMLSGYPSALYDELLDGWRSVSVQVINQAGVVTEKVWFNFEPDRVHCYRYARRNFTDRQRIKRKAETWFRLYRQMPPVDCNTKMTHFEQYCNAKLTHLRRLILVLERGGAGFKNHFHKFSK